MSTAYMTRFATWTLAMSLVVASTIPLMLVAGSPSLAHPLPLPLFTLGYVFGPLAMALPSVGFLLWNPQLLRGEAIVPRRSQWALVLLTALMVWYLVIAWPYGIRYQGRTYTILVMSMNVGVLAGLFALLAYARRAPSFRRSLAFHTAFFFGWAGIPFPISERSCEGWNTVRAKGGRMEERIPAQLAMM